MKSKYIFILCLGLIIFSSCRHKPVYPETGSLLIVSDPSSSDIYIDGQPSSQRTPARLDGIPVGWRSIKIKHYGYKSNTLNVEVRAGELRRLNLRLSAIRPYKICQVSHYGSGKDIAYDDVNQRIYLSHSMVNRVSEYQAIDSMVVLSRYFVVGMGPGCLACHGGLARLFVTVADTVKVINLNSGNIEAWSVPAVGANFLRLVFSPDGRAVLAADSAGQRILVLDPQNASLIRTINLPGVPSDIAIDGQGRSIYVTITEGQVFQKRDMETDAVINQMATGPLPGTIFRDETDSWCGYCNVRGQTFVPIRVSTWSPIQTPTLPLPSPLGDNIWGVCYAKNGDNIWILRTPVPETGNPAELPRGKLFLYDINTWNGVGNYTLGIFPLKMVPSRDGRYLYILEYFDVLVLKTDTE